MKVLSTELLNWLLQKCNLPEQQLLYNPFLGRLPCEAMLYNRKHWVCFLRHEYKTRKLSAPFYHCYRFRHFYTPPLWFVQTRIYVYFISWLLSLLQIHAAHYICLRDLSYKCIIVLMYQITEQPYNQWFLRIRIAMHYLK